MIEWLIAVVFTPTWAEQFLGQQGDVFDAQKDTALATAGAVIAIGVLALTGNRQVSVSVARPRSGERSECPYED